MKGSNTKLSPKSKKKLIEIEAAHEEWLKRAADEFNMYEKDVIRHVFDYVIKHNVMANFRSRVVSSELHKTLDELAKGVQDIASLKAKAEELLRQAGGREPLPD